MQEFLELIKRYETITLEEIQAVWVEPTIGDNSLCTANKLTGFGTCFTCTLCVRISNDCSQCVYHCLVGCVYLPGFNTSYYAIAEAGNPEELLIAFKTRAEILKEYLKELPNE